MEKVDDKTKVKKGNYVINLWTGQNNFYCNKDCIFTLLKGKPGTLYTSLH